MTIFDNFENLINFGKLWRWLTILTMCDNFDNDWQCRQFDNVGHFYLYCNFIRMKQFEKIRISWTILTNLTILTILDNLDKFWQILQCLKNFTTFDNFWQFLQFFTVLTSYDTFIFFDHNDKDNPSDLRYLRHWLQFLESRTWIH